MHISFLFVNFVFVIISHCVIHTNSYPIYDAIGTHYDAGFSIGQQAKQRIQEYLKSYSPMKTLRHCLLTTSCYLDLKDLILYNKRIWPQYFDELKGIAFGAKIEVIDLYLLSFKHEILSIMSKINMHHNSMGAKITQSIDPLLLQCSDILSNNNKFVGFGHNEDAAHEVGKYAFYSHYKFNDDIYNNELIGFEYPGSIIGHSFGFNKYNVATSMNAVFPTDVIIPARGAYFIPRAIMDAHNVSHAINIIMNYTVNGPVCSYGASINIGDTSSVINVEISNFNVSVEYYDNNRMSHGCHFNMYLRLNTTQQTDESSVKRLDRLAGILSQNTDNLMDITDITDILSDRNDKKYPFYRNSEAPDSLTTIATAIFDLEERVMIVYENCNPKRCPPTFNMTFDFKQH